MLLALTPLRAEAVSLASLFQGQTITADDKLFSNWTLLSQSTNDGMVDPTKIDVTPLVDDPLNPGVKYTAEFDALGTEFGHPPGAFARLRFSFTVATTSGEPLIKDNSLLVNGWVFDSTEAASINISETVRDGGRLARGTKNVVARPSDTPNSGNPNHFDTAEFAPQSSVDVETFIEILGPNTNDGARLTMFEQRFSQIPEPSSLAMVGVLAIFSLARARRRRS
jgi:hypothetical protein